MDYLYLLTSVILSVSCNYIFTKRYQMRAGAEIYANAMLLFINGIGSAAVAIIPMVIMGIPLAFTPYSLIMALLIVGTSGALQIVINKSFERGSLMMVSLLSTAGNIVLPSLVGFIWLEEPVELKKLAAILLVMVAVVLYSYQREKGVFTPLLLFLWVMVFVFNGLTSVLSKLHQVEQQYAVVDTYNFAMQVALVRTVLFFPVVFAARRQPRVSKKLDGPCIWLAIAAAATAGFAYILNMLCATSIPASVQYPLSSGMTVFLSAACGWALYREKISLRQGIGLAVCLVAILLYA